jgi:hypothetical protein
MFVGLFVTSSRRMQGVVITFVDGAEATSKLASMQECTAAFFIDIQFLLDVNKSLSHVHMTPPDKEEEACHYCMPIEKPAY